MCQNNKYFGTLFFKKMDEKNNIGSLFNRIADKYDFLNHLLSLNIDRFWRRKAVRRINGTANCCLDVAVGTADLAIEIIRQAKAQKVQGIDLSEKMMQIGRNKVQKRGLQDKITFMHANAQKMPFTDGSYEIVTCAYGVRNFSNLDEGLREMYRVLPTDGQLMILEFSYPSNRFVSFCYDMYFSHILPLVGRLLSRDRTAYSYLNKSVKNFIWGEQMCEKLRQAGFRQVSFEPLTFGISTIYIAVK